MLKIRFKVEDCEDDIYQESEGEEDNESEGRGEKEKEKEKGATPVVLSCVGWGVKNMALAAAI